MRDLVFSADISIGVRDVAESKHQDRCLDWKNRVTGGHGGHSDPVIHRVKLWFGSKPRKDQLGSSLLCGESNDG